MCLRVGLFTDPCCFKFQMLNMLPCTLIVLSKHYLIFLLEYAVEAQSAVREPSGWALARRDWVVGGRICRPWCLVTRISVAYRSGDFLTGVIFSYPLWEPVLDADTSVAYRYSRECLQNTPMRMVKVQYGERLGGLCVLWFVWLLCYVAFSHNCV